MKEKSKNIAERKEQFLTPSDLLIERFYTENWKEASDAVSDNTEPGVYPYKRGIYRTMYRSRLWTMRQYSGFGTPEDTNKRYHYLLQQGTTGLSVAFDLPTQMGFDADHLKAKGEVGRLGVSISTIDDMEMLLSGIPLDKISISVTINATAAILLALYIAIAQKRGVSLNQLQGTTQNDILKEYIARGTYIYPVAYGMRLVTDIFEYCVNEMTSFNFISISGYHIREAGSTAVDELAFTLANGIAYVESALKRGMAIDTFAPRLSFFFNSHIHFLEEIAKFRAARVLWAKIMKERFGAKKEDSWKLRFHTQTAGSTLTYQQPLNNAVRTTIESMAAVLGGTQSLHANGYDEALGLPSEESAALSVKTQQIIAYESGIADTADPLAGSYLIEAWTERMIKQVEERIKEIDAMGGMVKALEKYFPQGEIEKSAYALQKKIENNDMKIVGVNCFEEAEGDLPDVDENFREHENKQVHALKEFKKVRDIQAVNTALQNLQEGAKGTVNLIPLIIDAVKAKVTLGEISDVLRGVFGEYR
jgi:methylmalonyl-CoA mutase, N-terminal domain